MNEQLISFETAKLAQEKGFNQLCVDFINTDNEVDSLIKYIGDTLEEKLETAKNLFKYYKPTQSSLQKWLREEHNINVLVDYDNYSKIGYTFKIGYGEYPNDIEDHSNGKFGLSPFITYEKALEVGLQEALKLIKYEKQTS